MTPSEQVIPFVKASACGNDFLVVDGLYAPADIGSLSQRLCDRHQGVGADGVEWLFPADGVDIRARLFNADGSEAEISGNGTRCVAAHLCSEQPGDKFAIATGAGIKTCTLISCNQWRYEFEIAMGQPHVGEPIPVKVEGGEQTGTVISMGNPHFVVFVRQFPTDWQTEAAEIGRHPTFQDGTNVELVRVCDESNVEARFFERGVGETQSSGTGSCAAAVASISTGRARSPVQVHAPGGVQTVRWEEQVFLRGPAQIVCRGEFLG
jgi:diaminopimelate epimerase